MDTRLLLVCNFGSTCAVTKVVGGYSFKDFVSFICAKWNVLSEDSLAMSYDLGGNRRAMLENSEDFGNMVELMCAKGVDNVDIFVTEKGGGSSCVTVGEEIHALAESMDVGCISDGCNESQYHEVVRHQGRTVLLSDGWVNEIRHEGQVFEGGFKEFRLALSKYSIGIGFNYKFVKNQHDRVTAVCLKKNECSCKWRVHATLNDVNGFVYIITLNNVHVCGAVVQSNSHPRMGSSLVASLITPQIFKNPLTRPVDVIDTIKQLYGKDITYDVAWTAVEKARSEHYGSHAQSFDQLGWYFEEALKTNPNSRFVVDYYPGSRRFRRYFVSFGACIEGFEFCRPTLFLDGTFLKGRYKGNLLSATGKDGNQGLFHLAFAVVGSEDSDNWMWFMENLYHVVDHERTLTFISDRHKGLLAAVSTVFPSAHQAYCMHHMKLNLKEKLKRKNAGFREKIVKLFERCAYARNAQIFHKLMSQLVREGGDEVAAFMRSAPSKKWSNVYFRGKRYGDMCSNAAESFNSQIRDARHLAITNMIDCIRKKIMSARSKRKFKCRKWNSILCPKKDVNFREGVDACSTWAVGISEDDVLEVHSIPSATVNIRLRTCTCGNWQFLGFPCAHAFAALMRANKDIMSYIEPHFFVSNFSKSYSTAIGPVPTFDKPDFNEAEATVLPPHSRKQPGRTKRKRIPNGGENTRKVKCSRCGDGGHNRVTCKAPL